MRHQPVSRHLQKRGGSSGGGTSTETNGDRTQTELPGMQEPKPPEDQPKQ